MSEHHDAIVIGLGGMGSAAAYHLARRGQRVLGLDAHPPRHALGSSHGRSRIFRTAYTNPVYVPLVERAYRLWRALEEESGASLLTMTGMLLVGQAGTPMIDGPLASARLHHLPHEVLSPAEVHARFPGFRLTDDLVAVHEPRAGILDPEACVAAHLGLAARHGAAIRHGVEVRAVATDGEGVRVISDAGVHTAARAVITTGPWAGELLADLGLPLTVQRIVNVHVAPPAPELYQPARCPVFGWEVPEGHFYGFPCLPGQGIKLGRNTEDGACTPRTIRRAVDAAEIDPFRAMLARHMPGAAGPVTATVTCMYTNTPDGHFVIDRYPGHPAVALAAGCSGHAFKFTSVIGEVLAGLTLDSEPAVPIDFLSARRFAPARG